MNKIKTTEPKVLWKLRCKLGEGTLWVKEHNSIYFVDIKKKKFFSLNTKNNKKKIYKVNKEIGFLAHLQGYVFILGLQGELRIQNIKTKKIIKKIVIEKNIKLNRINDGKTDPNGNLWFGTMDNLERKIEKGSLYKLDKNLLLTKVDTDYRITNGPAFIDQYNFYHTDSSKKKIYKIKVNKDTISVAIGNVSKEREFKIGSRYDYYGDVKLLGDRKDLKFTGFFKLSHNCPSFAKKWISFSSFIDPYNISFSFSDDLYSDNDDKLYSGIYYNRDSSIYYSTFLSTKKRAKDIVVLVKYLMTYM